MYSVSDHGTMMADGVRVGAYIRALERTVKPGHIVVDIGTGSGLFAVVAAKLGARKVYAIESDEIIELARQVAKNNGCDDKIVFIRGLSTEIELPGKADVIVSDLHGGLPFFHTSLQSLIDARRRFLAPGGQMIPLRERIWVAAVELFPDDYGRVAVWTDGRWGVDLSVGARFGADHIFNARPKPSQLLTAPARLATIEHLTLESPSVNTTARLSVTRNGDCHGYSLWFDSELADGISISTAPSDPPTVYPNQFAPWPRPVAVATGDQIEAELRFSFVNQEYVTAWNSKVLKPDGGTGMEFRQSSFNSAFVSPDRLRRRSPVYRPELSVRGMGERRLLDLMDGTRTLEDVARIARRECPEAFPDEQSALKAAADLAERLTK